ncbi:SWIM zinc finger family protein [Cohnella soli]|uniref:SWIM zinc finger domain-containing protein n=1 Tax=Cohnella soli TaxID=425005 RepID=A0ABW0HQP0_9BACL
MISITEAYVDSLALNAAASKNGRDLVKKNSFPLLCRSEDDTLLFGECKGSGSEPYRCSVDFLKPDDPVFRCSCPSRQFPCKHILGLLYAYTGGKAFATAEIPQDIKDKRDKASLREEKKKEAETAVESDAKPRRRQSNKSALTKKIAAQLEGIELADKLLAGIVQSGLGSVDKKTVQTLADQVKQLGNYYIPGIQIAFRALLLELQSDGDRESMYTAAIPRLTLLHSLLKKAKEYLEQRLPNPDETPMDTASTLEEAIGHAWQLAELKQLGLTVPNTELLQLSFRSYVDSSREEFVDEGYWITLGSGHIHATRTYRPYRAAKFIKEEDSQFKLVQIEELFVYPGELNARVRWENTTYRNPQPVDMRAVCSHARRSFPEVVKQVKNQIKNPLSDKHPVTLLAYKEIVNMSGQYVLVDEQGKQIPLKDIAAVNHATTPMLSLLKQGDLRDNAMLVMFEHDLEQNRLSAQPLSVVTDQGVIRLLY